MSEPTSPQSSSSPPPPPPPPEAESLAVAARAALGSGELKKGLPLVRQALGLDASNAGAHATLSRVLLEMHRPRGARIEAEKALDLDPTCALGHEALGFVQMFERKATEARASFESAVASDPTIVDARRGLATLAESRGDAAARLAHLEAARRLAPERVAVLVELGVAHLAVGQESDAAALAEAAVALDGAHPGARVLEGRILLARGDLEAARESCARALSKRWSKEALELLAAIKWKQSRWSGPWFAFNAWFVGRESTASALTIGSFFVVYLLQLVLDDLDLPTAAMFVHYAWMFVSRWSHVAPTIFRRMVQNEIDAAGFGRRSDTSD